MIEIKKKLSGETERRRYIGSSFLEDEWLKKINNDENILFIAAGVFYFFEETEIRDFIFKLIDLFTGCEIVFDGTSDIRTANRAVLKRAGMNETTLLKWEIRDINAIKSWGGGIKEVNNYLMFRNISNKVSLRDRPALKLADKLKMQFVVQIKT